MHGYLEEVETSKPPQDRLALEKCIRNGLLIKSAQGRIGCTYQGSWIWDSAGLARYDETTRKVGQSYAEAE